MIRLGPGKPRIQFHEAHNDMSHFSNGYWEPNYYFYVTDEMYLKLLHFTDATLKEPSKKEVEDVVGKTIGELMGSSFAQRMRWVMELNPSKSQIWEFDGLAPDMKGFIRCIVFLGEPSLSIWSLFEAFVVLPILNVACTFLNRARYFKNKKEWAQWEKFLRKVS